MIRIMGGVWVNGQGVEVLKNEISPREVFELWKRLKRNKGRYIKQLEFNFEIKIKG